MQAAIIDCMAMRPLNQFDLCGVRLPKTALRMRLKQKTQTNWSVYDPFNPVGTLLKLTGTFNRARVRPRRRSD
jgi:hypothetical protein